jgi:RNA polymerase sigma factor (sigma-70 family)
MEEDRDMEEDEDMEKDEDIVPLWLKRLADGDEDAAREIWQKYFAQLVSVARRRLGALPRRVADEEDIAASAMGSFYRGVKDGRYAQLGDPNELWKLLATLTAHKAIKQARRHLALKRGGGLVRGESVFVKPDDVEAARGIAQVLGREPTPQFAAMMAESWGELLGGLDDETLRTVALYRIEGYTNAEIAEQLECSERTVERHLVQIRGIWQAEKDGAV